MSDVTQFDTVPQTLVAVDDNARSATMAAAFFQGVGNWLVGVDSERRFGEQPLGGGLNIGIDPYGQVFVQGRAGGTNSRPAVQSSVSLSPQVLLIGLALFYLWKHG